MSGSPATVVERLKASLGAAAAHDLDDAEKAVAINQGGLPRTYLGPSRIAVHVTPTETRAARRPTEE